MKRFTLAFIFDSTLHHVLLIHKNRPAWQAGKINAIGGKVEKGEASLTCIMRETREETNLQTEPEKWVFLGIMKGKDWQIDVFSYIYLGNPTDAKTMEDQPIEWFHVHKLPDKVIYNLRWLTHLAIDKHTNKDLETFTITFNDNNPT